MVLGLLVLGVVVLLAKRAFRAAARAGAPVAAPAPPAPPSPERCASLEERHQATWQALNHCDEDEDCIAIRRGPAYAGLDDCARFAPRAADPAAAAALAGEWISLGCPNEPAICESVPRAACRKGRCSERPPEPLPPSWMRVDVDRDFHFFMPSDLVEIPIRADEGGIHLWKNERMRVNVDYSGYGSDLQEPEYPKGIHIVSREDIRVSGDPAVLRIIEIEPGMMRGSKETWISAAIHAPHPPRSLSLSATCKAPCPEAETIVRSLVFRHGARPVSDAGW
ncbi:Hypothetical protein A7982_06870 [Minicystis rosea]|nr:Hypothetical protein A7982_06870 [Minicystis rosea]